MAKKKAISSYLFRWVAGIMTVVLTLMVLVYILSEIADYQSNIKRYLQEYRRTHQEMAVSRVNQTIQYIRYSRNQTENEVQELIRQRVEQAADIAEGIYGKMKSKADDKEIADLIIGALREIRYHNRNSYIFVITGDGEMLLHGALRFERQNLIDFYDLEGKRVIHDLIEMGRRDGSGYARYLFYKPKSASENEFQKLSYVYHFKPYDWIIGTGEYLDDIEYKIQQNINQYVMTHRQRENFDDFIFIIKLLNINGGDRFGSYYANAIHPEQVGQYLHESITDSRGKMIYKEALEGLRDKGQAFVDYSIETRKDKKIHDLSAYFKLLPELGLIVGVAYKQPDINKILSGHRKSLKAGLVRNTILIIILNVSVILALLLFTKRFRQRIQDEFTVFNTFFNLAAASQEQIDTEMLSFSEFQELSIAANEMIRARIQANRDVQRAETLQKQILRSARNVSLILIEPNKPHLPILEISAGGEHIFGYSREDLTDTSLMRLYTGDGAIRLSQIIETIRLNGKGISEEGTMIRKSGEKFPAMIDFQPVFDSDNSLTYIVQMCVDITNRKKTEQQLAQERERLLVTLRSIGDGVVVTDLNGNIQLMNRIAEEITGWSMQESQNRQVEDVLKLVDGHTGEPLANPVRRVLDSQMMENISGNVALLSRSGQQIAISDSAAPIRDMKSRVIGVVMVFRDITEKKRAEEELFKAKKLESIGVLAGGIAHDFNNMLTSLFGYLSLAKTLIPSQSPGVPYLEKAEHSLERAKDLSGQLLTFSRGGTPIKQVVDIGQLIRQTAEFVLTGSAIKLIFNLDDNLWSADVDKGQISQVVTNLVINAKQAMGKGGTLTIRGANLILPLNNQWHLPLGNYVQFIFQDDGPGIPAKYLDQIFDPFFTTKNQGNGLGLASVYSIVQRHKGAVSVQSNEGKGAAFTILLPATGKAAPTAQIIQKKKEAAAKKARILIMDDEKPIRDLGTALLMKMGHRPTVSESGEQALELFKTSVDAGDPFDLVILDLTVPGGLGGAEIIDDLKQLNSKLKAIVSSGYASDPVMAEFEKYGFDAVLVKPYLLKEMENLIREILA
jgi:PAS domain S-box-containing protein